MMLLLTIFVTLVCVSCALDAYEQELDITEPGVSIKIKAEAGSELVQLTIEGPSHVWFGVGFGETRMHGTYGIITYKDLLPIWNVEEYRLGNHTRGNKLTNTSLKILETTTIDNGQRIRVKIQRKRIDNATPYNFPLQAQTQNADDCEYSVFIIAAKGVERDYTTATSMAPNSSVSTFTCSVGRTAGSTTDCCSECESIAGNGADDCVAGVDCIDCVADDHAPCFDSNSYVLMYPDYERKSIDSLEIYDKILTYDMLNDEYIWDELLIKIHCAKGEYLNDILVPMIEFTFKNNQTLTMTDKHLLYIFDKENDGNLYRADKVKIGDKMKQMDGELIQVISIKNVAKYPRNLITYNTNLVINGIVISSFPETIWGESKYWGQSLRFIAKYFYSYNIWRYPVFCITKIWNEYISFDLKETILQFYFIQNKEKIKEKNRNPSYWYSSFMS